MTNAGIVVVGAGVAGLGAALALSRDGHRVTLIERDATPLPADPSAAFEWDRRGAPQVRHSHAFLARLRNLLRDPHPDVLAALLDAGATEMRLHRDAARGDETATPRPGDDDLVALACRRTTFEWVLRRAVLASSDARVLDGVAVEGLVAEPVRTARADRHGRARRARVPIAATSGRGAVGAARRCPTGSPRSAPAQSAEEVEDTGIVYFSRFFELVRGR